MGSFPWVTASDIIIAKLANIPATPCPDIKPWIYLEVKDAANPNIPPANTPEHALKRIIVKTVKIKKRSVHEEVSTQTNTTVVMNMSSITRSELIILLNAVNLL